MRIAIVSDIHGNLPALEAVLAHARGERVGLIINAGDMLSGPLWPAETAALLRRSPLAAIRGNHERALLAAAGEALTDSVGKPLPAAIPGAADHFAAHRLDAAQRAWLAALPATLRPASDVFVCHGRPDDDLEYLLETVTPDGARLATNAELSARCAGVDAALIVCGHSHLPRLAALDDGRMVVNPGSVGLPAFDDDHPHPHVMETGSPHASYAVCTRTPAGWQASLHRVAYDHGAAVRRAAEAGFDDWARWLATGRALADRRRRAAAAGGAA